jgi:hypothetical protein
VNPSVLNLGKTAQNCSIYTCVKIALRRPDPAHDADPGMISFIFNVRFILFVTGAGRNYGSETLCKFYSLLDAEPVVRNNNINCSGAAL